MIIYLLICCTIVSTTIYQKRFAKKLTGSAFRDQVPLPRSKAKALDHAVAEKLNDSNTALRLIESRNRRTCAVKCGYVMAMSYLKFKTGHKKKKKCGVFFHGALSWWNCPCSWKVSWKVIQLCPPNHQCCCGTAISSKSSTAFSQKDALEQATIAHVYFCLSLTCRSCHATGMLKDRSDIGTHHLPILSQGLILSNDIKSSASSLFCRSVNVEHENNP